MSYILDALKKAERERGIAKIPNLETIHKTPGSSNKNLWLGSAIVLLLVVVGISMYFILRNGAGKSVPDSKDYASKQELTKIPDTAESRIPPIGEQELPSQPNVNEGSSGTSASSGNAGQAPNPVTNRDRTSSPVPDNSTQELKNTSPSTESSPNPPLEENIESYPDDASMPFNSPAAETDSTSHAAALQQAIQEMRVSIHQYSETPAKRMIFINGRKYLEGDFVDGIYLIERITPDGAVLRYEDAQATLKVSM